MKTEAGKSRIERAESRPATRARSDRAVVNNNAIANRAIEDIANKSPQTPPGPAPSTPPGAAQRIADLIMSDTEDEAPQDVDIANIAKNAYLKIAAEMLGNLGRHVSEIYSPPRVTSYAHKLGLLPGFALDLLENDPYDNKPWDFRIKEKRDRAYWKVKKEKPFVLVVAPRARHSLHYLNQVIHVWTQ